MPPEHYELATHNSQRFVGVGPANKLLFGWPLLQRDLGWPKIPRLHRRAPCKKGNFGLFPSRRFRIPAMLANSVGI